MSPPLEKSHIIFLKFCSFYRPKEQRGSLGRSPHQTIRALTQSNGKLSSILHVEGVAVSLAFKI